MTAAERSEMLIRIDERTERVEKLLLGNGQPGLIDKFNTLNRQHQLVYDRQKNCMLRQEKAKEAAAKNQKEKKVDIKWLVVLIIMVLAILKDFLF